MLQRLHVDNYKCLVNFDLPLRELSLLLGPNGVGKTSVLDIVFALHRLLGDGARIADADVFPTRALTRWQQRIDCNNSQVLEHPHRRHRANPPGKRKRLVAGMNHVQ